MLNLEAEQGGNQKFSPHRWDTHLPPPTVSLKPPYDTSDCLNIWIELRDDYFIIGFEDPNTRPLWPLRSHGTKIRLQLKRGWRLEWWPPAENKLHKIQVAEGASRSDNSPEMDGLMTSLVWLFNKSPLSERTRWVFPAAPRHCLGKNGIFDIFFPCVLDEGTVLLSADPRTSPGAPEWVRIT